MEINIKNNFADIIQESDWMGEKDKEKTIEKVYH